MGIGNQKVESSNSGVPEVLETVITINLDENRENADSRFGGEDGDMKNEVKVKGMKEESSSFSIDVRCESGYGKFGEDMDEESQIVCRICHLNSIESGKKMVDLIEIGCSCKGELGFVHSDCAEAWFKLKGNRLCEICGAIAQNVTGVGDNRFIEEWNDGRYTASGTGSNERGRGWWRGQPFCNFLMACLVIAFVLPWFFRVNMF